MNSTRPRRLAALGIALLALAAAGCSSTPSDLSNGASAADPDAAETTLLAPIEPAAVDGMTSDTTPAPAIPAEETADVVVETQDGAASQPAGEDPAQEMAVQGPDTAEVCAIVEFGYLGLLNGDVGVDLDSRLTQGAQAALVLDDERYVQSGEALLEAVGSDDAGNRADALLAFCADDGFERLG